MQKIKKISLLGIVIMTIVSFSNLLGLGLAGTSIFIGIAFFFINKFSEKQQFKDSGLDIKSVRNDLKVKNIWLWILAPIVMNIVSITIAKLFVPEYIDHVITRAGAIASFDASIIVVVVQFAIFALGEEIAWRAFYQKQLSKTFSIVPILIISSVLFALGHIANGDPLIVLYDIFFVFINSVLYGIVFHKTNNAYISTISHFFANLFSFVVLILL